MRFVTVAVALIAIIFSIFATVRANEAESKFQTVNIQLMQSQRDFSAQKETLEKRLGKAVEGQLEGITTTYHWMYVASGYRSRDTVQWALKEFDNVLAEGERRGPGNNVAYNSWAYESLPVYISLLRYAASMIQYNTGFETFATADEVTDRALRLELLNGNRSRPPYVHCEMNNIWLDIGGRDSKTHGPKCR